MAAKKQNTRTTPSSAARKPATKAALKGASKTSSKSAGSSTKKAPSKTRAKATPAAVTKGTSKTAAKSAAKSKPQAASKSQAASQPKSGAKPATTTESKTATKSAATAKAKATAAGSPPSAAQQHDTPGPAKAAATQAAHATSKTQSSPTPAAVAKNKDQTSTAVEVRGDHMAVTPVKKSASTAAPERTPAGSSTPAVAAGKSTVRAAERHAAEQAPVDGRGALSEPTAASRAPAESATTASVRIVWHDLMSTDVDRTRQFYAALLPWRTKVVAQPPLGTTHRIEAGGRELGSYVALPTSEGIPSHWMPYAQVTNLDAVVRRARELGGFVPVPPTVLEGVGRFAVIADPRGAHISPIEPLAPFARASTLQPGVAAWNEVLTDDPDSTARFFAEVFGWSTRKQDLGALGPATIFTTPDDNTPVAGCRHAPSGVAPQWLVAWTVTNADQSAAKVRQHGGQIVVAPTDVPGMGKVVLAKDPDGAHVSLFQPAP